MLGATMPGRTRPVVRTRPGPRRTPPALGMMKKSTVAKVAALAVLAVVAFRGCRGWLLGPAVYWQDFEGRSAGEVLDLLGEPIVWSFADAYGMRISEEERDVRNAAESEPEVFMSWAFGFGHRMQIDFADGVAVRVHRWTK